MPGNMTRRSAMGLLGAGGLAGALTTAKAPSAPASASAEPKTLAEVLRPGAPFGRWTVAEVHPVERGALRVDVAERDGHVFAVEILARDPAASKPPAEVGELAIYVCNGGDGWVPTVEEQGLAAMTLGALLEKHGQTGPIGGLMTHAARVVAHADVLHATFIGA